MTGVVNFIRDTYTHSTPAQAKGIGCFFGGLILHDVGSYGAMKLSSENTFLAGGIMGMGAGIAIYGVSKWTPLNTKTQKIALGIFSLSLGTCMVARGMGFSLTPQSSESEIYTCLGLSVLGFAGACTGALPLGKDMLDDISSRAIKRA